MEKDKIQFGDWHRFLFGEAPPEFMVEVLIRALVVMAGYIVVARLFGKRMNGQLTVTEYAVMISLGAIIAPAIQLPDRGILLGLMILCCVLMIQRLLTRFDYKFPRWEKITQGVPSILIEDGVLCIERMSRDRISRQQILAMLRSKQIGSLGEVRRMYMEACGDFSIYRFGKAVPGLSTLSGVQGYRTTQDTTMLYLACDHCGYVKDAARTDKLCPNCSSSEWVLAIPAKSS